MTDLKEILKQINVITPSGQINKKAKFLLSKYPDIERKVINKTSFLNNDTMRVRIYCIMNDIIQRPKCLTCGTPMKFNQQKKRFNNFCANSKSKSCASQHKDTQEKYKKTMIERYGVENPSQHNEIKEKRKNTNQTRYGGNSPSSSRDVKDKIKTTCLERYGTTNPMQNISVQKKSRRKMVEKYGTFTFAQSNVPQEILDKLNDKSWLISQYVYSNKSIKRISNEIGIGFNLVKRAIKLFNIEKDNLPHLGIKNVEHPPNLLKSKEWLEEQLINRNMSKKTIANALNINSSYVHRWCQYHGLEKTGSHYSSISFSEKELLDFIKSVIPDEKIIKNTRDIIPPYEIDIYIPNYNLAIEFCGIYWHSELSGKDKQYHIQKMNMCRKQNIHLIQIWSSEWEFKKEIVKSRISSLLGKNQRIYARKCDIVEISSRESRDFLDKSHLQGFNGGNTHLSLQYQGKIVAVMTFGESRFTKRKSIEMIRYAPKPFLNIIGGASKIFKFFIKTQSPKSIVSYSDRRWNTGKLYYNLGFKKTHESLPNYYYFQRNTNTNILHSRIAFQKHKLADKLETFDPNLTEWKNMKANGYDRIWDCGNDVFVWSS